VTVELAFSLLGFGAAVVVGAGVFAIGLAQLQCDDAAAAIARQVARDDLGAVQEIRDGLAPSLAVATVEEGREVVVSVSNDVRPWGSWLPAFTVAAQARAVREGS
jgi:hypothetical protein